METTKKSKITQCTYDKVWVGKTDGKEMHYHWLDLENGEKVKVCVEEKMPTKLSPGTTIEYIKNETSGIIKMVQYYAPGSAHQKADIKPKENIEYTNFQAKKPNPAFKGNYTANKVQNVGAGVSGSYAKDIIISLINQGNKKAVTNPIAMWKEFTNEIHTHLKSIENNEPTN
jgi:hypothetical protein